MTWDLDRPDMLLARLDRDGWLAERGALYCRVHEPGGAEELRGVTRVWTRPPPTFTERREASHVAIAALGLGDWSAQPTELIVPVVVRPGPALMLGVDYELFDALRFGWHGLVLPYGEPLLVTPHGWLATFDRLGARLPRADVA